LLKPVYSGIKLHYQNAIFGGILAVSWGLTAGFRLKNRPVDESSLKQSTCLTAAALGSALETAPKKALEKALENFPMDNSATHLKQALG